MISVKMTKTETLRKELKLRKPGKLSHKIKPTPDASNRPIVRKTTKNENKQHQEKVVTKRVRKCSKAQPLPPTHTGSTKSKKKNIAKKSKPRFKITKKKSVMKTKRKEPTEKKPKSIQKMSRKKQGKKSISKSSNRKVESGKANVMDATKEQPNDGVVFNPSSGCVACLEGRTGEGGKKCWGCRLRRLQNIQNILPWNTGDRE